MNLKKSRFSTALQTSSCLSSADVKAASKKSRRDKLSALGATNEVEYFFARCRREFAKFRESINPRMILAKLRAKTYDHVFSIGTNCEPAFRFALSWKFIDSTPFAWASCPDTPHLTEVILHPELIGSEGFSFLDDILMWNCRKTGINFHGKLVPDPAIPKNTESILADKADLEARLAYLNDKFTRILSDTSSKAIIFRPRTAEAIGEDANEKINALQMALERRGARNYTLVIVVERSVGKTIKSAPGRVVRSVKAFNPKNAVTSPELGDPLGWKAIYREFAPKKILLKKRTFKFEMR